jgi:hypothetical protein
MKTQEVLAVKIANGMKAVETGFVGSTIIYVVATVVKAVLM